MPTLHDKLCASPVVTDVGDGNLNVGDRMSDIVSPVHRSDGEPSLEQWVGSPDRRREVISPGPLEAFHATFDHAAAEKVETGSVLPPLAHWLYFLPREGQGALGDDGHPRRGGFMPPVPLPRRMWAAGHIEFHRPLHVGREMERVSTIMRIEAKQGRTGPLVFVTIRHEIRDGDSTVLVETQVIVYSDHVQPGAQRSEATTRAPTDETFARVVMPNPVLLFRYSALTFNSHRIHYDRPYAVEVEGYRGLVVHGPLVATLLADLVSRDMPGTVLRSFEFRATRALTDLRAFTLCGRPSTDGSITLWARDHEGMLAMRARADVMKARPDVR